MTTSLVVATQSNPMMILSMADSGQSMSYLQYINRKNAMGLDKGADSFYASHPSSMLGNPALRWVSDDSVGSTLRRALAVSQGLATDLAAGENSNPKLAMKGYTRYFIVNAFTLIVLNLVAWALSLVFRQLRALIWEYRLGRTLHKIFHHNFVVVVFFLTASEMTLMAHYQFQHMSMGSVLDGVSSVAAVITMVYYIGFFLYMVFLVVQNTVYEDQEYRDKFAILIVPFKHKNISQRLLPTFYLLRKFLVSAVLVYLYSHPVI